MNDLDKTKEFWQRQFSTTVTSEQKAFDVLMGIFMPIVCIQFDPLSFLDTLFASQVFVYSFIGLEMLTLGLWLLWGAHLGRWAAFIGGIFFSGALFALMIGILLLPLTILALIIGIGILGTVPFLTCFVFFRNSSRALQEAEKTIRFISQMILFVLGIAFIIGIPSSMQSHTTEVISESIQQVIEGQSVQEAAEKINALPWCFQACSDQLVWAYESASTDVQHQQIVADIYEALTGKDIGSRYVDLLD
jgi:hypothetical protein